VGEVVRRATGTTVGGHFREMFLQELGADVHLGLPDSEHHRVAEFEWPAGGVTAPTDTSGLDAAQLLAFNTYNNPIGTSGGGTVNTPEWRRAEIPSTNTHASARGVERVYRELAAGGGLLLSTDGLLRISAETSNGLDIVLDRNSRFGHGVQIPIPERGFGPSLAAFGHYGAGGSVGFCDPAAGVSFGYVMNQMGPRWQNPRNRALIEALYSCL
jgi:CubicO group peptidase (beta-lactamase class C family)